MIEPRPRRILLVDDDPNLLVVLAEQLRDDGYEVATARDGQEALRRLEAGWPDLILLDLMMPQGRRPGPGPPDQGRSGPADHRPVGDRHGRQQGPTARRSRRGLRLQAVPLPGAAGPNPAGPATAGRSNPAPVDGPRAEPDARPAPPAATVAGTEVQLTPTESRLLHALAANLGEPSRPRRCWPEAGPTPRRPTRRTSGFRCAGCARRSRSTRIGPSIC
jgi:hypothetical protein